ncbi:MAG: ATP-binding protein [Thermoguttaceae bacterium]
MIPRLLQQTIEQSLRNFPIVGLIGARQTGKTTLAKAIGERQVQSVVYLDLEVPSDLAKLTDAELYLRSHTGSLVVVDEVQRKPDLFPLLRALADADQRNGKFLLLGSASPDLSRQASESLAGRIAYHELSPLLLQEVSPSEENVNKLWLRGGFPKSFLASAESQSLQWRNNLIQTYLERDIPQLGVSVPATSLRRFWQMIAHWQGQLWNASTIAKSLAVTSPTVKRYLDLLEDTFMLRQLAPYFANIKKRLVKTPKVYLRDSGLLHALLRIQSLEDMAAHPAAGASWEGWVIEQILGIVPEAWGRSFYRTAAGAEIDLLLEPGGRRSLIAIEVKYSLVPQPSRGFWTALEDLQPIQGFVVYPGHEYYPIKPRVFALPIAELQKLLEVN